MTLKGAQMQRSHVTRPSTVLTRWLGGAALVTWRYLWETTPLHRGGECHGDDSDRPPPLPPGTLDDRVQLPEHGYGPLFHRHFRVRIADADLDAGQLTDRICRDFKHFVPHEVVDIHTGPLPATGLTTGDELLVEMPGPWNGPVKVTHRDATSLHLVTLHGHMEAGQVRFTTHHDHDLLVFDIELWARPANRLIHLLYSHLRLAKEIQLNMWVRFCQAAATTTHGRPTDGIHITTHTLNHN